MSHTSSTYTFTTCRILHPSDELTSVSARYASPKSPCTHSHRQATEMGWRWNLNPFLVSGITGIRKQLLTRSKHCCLIGLGRSSDEEDDLELYHMVVMAKVEQAL